MVAGNKQSWSQLFQAWLPTFVTRGREAHSVDISCVANQVAKMLDAGVLVFVKHHLTVKGVQCGHSRALTCVDSRSITHLPELQHQYQQI